MRFLGIGDSCDLGAMYLELLARGHEVRVFVSDAEGRDTCAGLVQQVVDWRHELDWVADGVIVFETAHHGELQDDLRRRGFAVVGGSALGDRLEGDRELGQSALRAAGLSVTPTRSFDDFAAAAAFLEQEPGRYVLKFNGAGFSSGRTYVGERDDGADVIAMLAWHAARWRFAEAPSFILMEHRRGVEIGVGAFFDGRAFVRPACLDWEHKRFFPGDLGEMTGEMGTLATFSGSEKLFAATLARLAGPLADSGYRGWINLNTIVNRDGVWPLELTCRFGYPGFAVLRPLQALGWDELLLQVAHARAPHFPSKAGYSVGVVLTVPPFPRHEGYESLGKGLPIAVADSTAEDADNLHWAEVALVDGRLVTSGQVGYVGVVTGIGESAEAARTAAYRRVRKVILPTVRYRNDIGQRFIAEDRAELQALGWL